MRMRGRAESTVLLRLLRKEVVFDPEALKAMSIAYEGVRETMHLRDDDLLAEIVAKNVIEIASLGQLDPDRLRDLVLARMRL